MPVSPCQGKEYHKRPWARGGRLDVGRVPTCRDGLAPTNSYEHSANVGQIPICPRLLSNSRRADWNLPHVGTVFPVFRGCPAGRKAGYFLKRRLRALRAGGHPRKTSATVRSCEKNARKRALAGEPPAPPLQARALCWWRRRFRLRAATFSSLFVGRRPITGEGPLTSDCHHGDDSDAGQPPSLTALCPVLTAM